MKVIGFEGQFDEDALVTWTTPALADEDWVLNPRTQARFPRAQVTDLIRQGHLTAFPKPRTIEPADGDNPLVLVIVNKSNPICAIALVDTGRAGGLVKSWHDKRTQYYLFSGPDAFDRYAQNVSTRILSRTIDGDINSDTARSLISIGLTLRSHDPFLNVQRVLISKAEPTKAKDLALARISDPRDRQEFERFLAAYTESTPEYKLKYDKGIAEGGGFDIDVGADTFKALDTVHEYVAPLMKEIYPFLIGNVPPPRLMAMNPGSAELVFATNLKGRPLRERLGRYLELRLVEQILSGEIPKSVIFDREMEQAVRRIAQPTPETVVTYTSLKGGETQSVSLAWAAQSEIVRSPHFSALVYQSGLMKDGAKIELHLSPRRTITVSSQYNGEGSTPEGMDYLQNDRDFLCRPLVATLCRHTNDFGREEFWLIRLESLKPVASQRITAIPSAVVDGAVLIGLDIAAKLDEFGTIHSSIGEVPGTNDRRLSAARAWMVNYVELCANHELTMSATDPIVFLRSVRPTKVSALARVLLALASIGGRATIAKLVARINSMFSTYVRDNNTRREVLKNDRLVGFIEDDPQTVFLTDAGTNWARLFRLATPPENSDASDV